MLPGPDDFVIVCAGPCQGRAVKVSFGVSGGGARALAALLALAALGVSRSAHARDVAYLAPPECPKPAQVTARIEASAARGESTSLVVEKTKSGFHGAIVIGEGERRVVRSVDAKSCGAVVEALELSLALRAEEDAATQAEDAASSTPTPANGVEVGRDETTQAGADAPAATARRVTTEARPRWSLGASFAFSSFSEGRTLFGAALFGDVALPSRLFDVSFLQPSIRVSFGATLPSTSTTSRLYPSESYSLCFNCGPSFTTVKAAVDLCPVGVNLEGTTSLAACTRAEVGVLTADMAKSGVTAAHRPWLAAGPIVRARVTWPTGSVRPSFELFAGLLAPLVRHRFEFEGYPSEIAPPWSWTVGTSVGVVF